MRIDAGISESPRNASLESVIIDFMKTVKSTIIWTTIIFVTLTLLTMKNEAASDGFSVYGFPVVYYDHFEGKCDNCYGKFGFKPINLLIDILFAMSFGFLVTIVKGKFLKTYDNEK